MPPFEQLLYNRFADGIRSWDTARYPDIYAISLLYSSVATADAEGDEIWLEGLVELSYNTVTHFRQQIEHASDIAEARWNYAFWLQEITLQVPRLLDPEYGTNPDLAVRDDWCSAQGLVPRERDSKGRPLYGGAFEHALAHACSRVTRRLHEDGVIVQQVGQTVPVIIHTLTYAQAGLNATRAGNPPEAVQEFFAEWAEGG